MPLLKTPEFEVSTIRKCGHLCTLSLACEGSSREIINRAMAREHQKSCPDCT